MGTSHALALPIVYLDNPWNHDFNVVCTCGWVDSKVSHDADKRGHAYPNLVARSEQVISLHALQVNLLALLTNDHELLHSHDKTTKAHHVTSLKIYQSRPGSFDVSCTDSCGYAATLTNRKYLKGRLTLTQLATDLRRQFYAHCYTLSPNPVTSDLISQ